MKKTISILLVLLMSLAMLTACNFTSNYTPPPGAKQMEGMPAVEKMLEALTMGDVETSASLLHPNMTDGETAIGQMVRYIAGRKITNLEQVGLNVHKSSGTAGDVTQEKGTFYVELEDGEQFYLSVYYLIDNNGSGIQSFQIVLGIA